MEAGLTAIRVERKGILDRVLPLGHWLGPESAQSLELGQAGTRLWCTLVSLLGFIVIGRFAELPAGIVGVAVVFPIYAIGYSIHVRLNPAPTHVRRGLAILMDNLVGGYVASFGGMFAAYVGFNFLTTVGWGLRFGRHYLFLATAIALLSMVWILAASPYWQDQQLFGATIIFGLVANTINTSILLGRIASANRRLAEKIEEVAQLAGQDQLTRLPNRLYFQERLSQTLAAAARNGRRVALLLFDIDGFKAVNDTLGHEAGDRLLEEIARRVGGRMRQSDTFARLGGDEFVVLMELAHDNSDAISVAEAVLSAIAEIDLYAVQGLRVSASIGIACSDTEVARERIADELLLAADRAMYEAKRAGKGCYRFADERVAHPATAAGVGPVSTG
jgi:diguanylate cyclase (GGDEF)-like protein